MNVSQEVTDYSRNLKEEAGRLLAETKLLELLSQFGEAKIGGSYAYDLLVDRDLDFGVAVSSVTPEVRVKIVSLFASQPWAYSVKITDRVNFKPHSHLDAPLGLYLGLTIPFPEQKSTILNIKYELMKRGKKDKGLTSASIYKAVIQNGINSTEEFLAR